MSVKRVVWVGMLVSLVPMTRASGQPHEMGTAFTYQGQLEDDGSPANGQYDFEFKLCDDPVAACTLATTTAQDHQVDDGLFTVEIHFGSDVFNGQARWLEMGVRPGASVDPYTTLTPRQELTPAPHALALPGLWTQQNATCPNLIAGYSGNTVSPGISGATIGGGGADGVVNSVTANFGTVAGGDLNVASGGWATVGGGGSNSATNTNAVVAGGAVNNATGYIATVGGGEHNTASQSYATVGGGNANHASGGQATVGGGAGNTASAVAATVGGGNANHASGGQATVGGGAGNTASAVAATVGGGNANTASGTQATVGGGQQNQASANYATIGGGGPGPDEVVGWVCETSTACGNCSIAGWLCVTDTDCPSGQTCEPNDANCSGDAVCEWNVRYRCYYGPDHGLSCGECEGGPYAGSLCSQEASCGVGGTCVPDDSVCGSPGTCRASYPGNRVIADWGTIGGGAANTASGSYATVGGGYVNEASGLRATVGGGQVNTASGNYATVGGGMNNIAWEVESTVVGGASNTASGFGSTVGGGVSNSAGGDYSFAAGYRASALHDGAFVWADSDWNEFASTSDNTFLIRASGGVGIGKNDPSEQLDVEGNIHASGTITSGSSITIDGVNDRVQCPTTMELHVGGARAVRLEPNATSPNLIGGYSGNSVTAGAFGATIGGGGQSFAENRVTDDHGTVGGGRANQAGDDWGTTDDAARATVGGGSGNTAYGRSATIGGGHINTAGGLAATIGGGASNNALGSWSTVGGGLSNSAGGDYSFAAGRMANASQEGSFVWADSTAAGFGAERNDQFRVRANGGARFDDGAEWVNIYDDGTDLITTSTGAHLTLGGVWTDTSDRAQKDNHASVDVREVLRRVSSVPVSTWHFKVEDSSVRHMGVMAQDFYAAFGLGNDERHIAALDTGGVALAAIQGLHEIVQEKERKIEMLRAEKDEQIAELAARLAALEQLVKQADTGQEGGGR